MRGMVESPGAGQCGRLTAREQDRRRRLIARGAATTCRPHSAPALLAASLIVLITACSGTSGLRLDRTVITLAPGERYTLSATSAPEGRAVRRLSWSSDDESVATVGEDGTVSAVAGGQATIHAVSLRGGHVAWCTVTVAAPRAEGQLLITEVGASPWTSTPGWVELYNPGSQPVDLAAYRLRTTGRLIEDPWTYYDDLTFDLPAHDLYPGSYVVLYGRYDDSYESSAQIVMVRDGQNRAPNWANSEGGFVELLRAGETVDFLRFGVNETEPTNGGWSGAGAADLPEFDAAYGSHSLARSAGSPDGDTAADWHYRSFSTPGGPNDITSTIDLDGDGIPDENEAPGRTFAGLPLYDWGARPGVTDIFVHINYMEHESIAFTPQREALEKVRETFAKKGIAIHIDVGDAIDRSPGINPERFDYSDTDHEVPFARYSVLTDDECAGDCRGVRSYKYEYMPIARKQIFHYCLFGNEEELSIRDGSPGGVGEYGNDFVVYFSSWAETDLSDTGQFNALLNKQAGTFFHELGHNLGLGHGGFETLNYKPNYVSRMNYLYSAGLPEIGHPDEGDRYYREYGLLGYQWTSDLHRNAYDGLDRVILDYSHGEGDPLDESAVEESRGLYQPGSAPVDYNGDGDTDDVLQNFNTNTASDWGFVDQEIGVLEDHDDWGTIEVFFARVWSAGLLSAAAQRVMDSEDAFAHFEWFDPVGNDMQPTVPCFLPAF